MSLSRPIHPSQITWHSITYRAKNPHYRAAPSPATSRVSFLKAFGRRATVQAASLRSAGIRNPQQTRKVGRRQSRLPLFPQQQTTPESGCDVEKWQRTNRSRAWALRRAAWPCQHRHRRPVTSGRTEPKLLDTSATSAHDTAAQNRRRPAPRLRTRRHRPISSFSRHATIMVLRVCGRSVRARNHCAKVLSFWNIGNRHATY